MGRPVRAVDFKSFSRSALSVARLRAPMPLSGPRCSDVSFGLFTPAGACTSPGFAELLEGVMSGRTYCSAIGAHVHV